MTRRLVIALLVAALCDANIYGPSSVYAAEESDISGNWYFAQIDGVPGHFICIASLVHQGSTLSSFMSCNVGYGELQGSIDEGGSNFSLSGELLGLTTMNGTIPGSIYDADGTLSFSVGKKVVSGSFVGVHGPFARGIVRCPTEAIGIIPARRVESLDALLLLQFTAQLKGASLACSYLGDVNIDGDLDATDANLILQIVAGLIDEFPPPQ